MCAWIIKIFEQFVLSLDNKCDIVDIKTTVETITQFEKASLTKEQLLNSNILKNIQSVYDRTKDEFLRYRLEIVLKKWYQVVMEKSSKSVFEAVLTGDDKFFETTSVPELCSRLVESIDKNFKVIDMATVLDTISILQKLDVSSAQMTQSNLMNFIQRLHDHTTNIYLAKQLGNLLMKWTCPPVIKGDLDEKKNSSMVVKLKLSKEIIRIVHVTRLKGNQ